MVDPTNHLMHYISTQTMGMWERENGEWILYTDHISALEAVKATVKTLDRQKAADAAVKANDAYGQWMPERWLHLFLDAYEDKL